MPNTGRIRYSTGFGVVLAIAVMLARPVWAAGGINVGAGNDMSLGNALTTLGCGDLTVSGTLHLDSAVLNDTNNAVINSGGQLDGDTGTLNMSGDWSNDGTFNADTSKVNMNDGCGVSNATIAGSTTFNELKIATANGRQVAFTAGTTQTVNTALTLTGTAGNLLKLRSTSDGSPAFLKLANGGSQSISYVDVKDNHATGLYLAPGSPASFDSVDSGGNLRWFLNALIPPAVPSIPTLSGFGLLLLTLSLALGLLWRRRRPADDRFQA